MDITADDLHFILELSRAKTLTAAALLRSVDQSTLSRQLTNLEEKIGAQLFARHRQGLTPSPLALSLLTWAQKIELVVREARRTNSAAASPGVIGEVHLSCPGAIADRLIAPYLSNFFKLYPGIKLRITCTPDRLDLDQLECDIVVRAGVKPKGDVVFVRLAETPIVPFAHVNNAAEFQGKNLADLPLVHRDEWITGESRKIRDQAPRSLRFSSNLLTTCLIAAEAGAGVVLIPRSFGEQLPQLTEIPVADWEPIMLPLYLASPSAVRRLPHVSAVWDWLKSTLTPETFLDQAVLRPDRNEHQSI